MNATDEQTARWALRILGDFALLRDGEVVKRFASRREDELLAYLALDAAVPKHRDEIVQVMWPDAERRRGLKHLSFGLFMLKKMSAQRLTRTAGLHVLARTRTGQDVGALLTKP